ncbi:MAG: cytochrome c [Saprospiraceae bacterium]|nr:cytochrome c [Saprospiraceae bacterium]
MMIRNTISLALLAALLACGNGDNAAKMASAPSAPAVDGAKIFKVSCAICHGNDGKLGLNGSKDLSVSVLSLEDRIALITTGKGLMPAQGSILKSDEIKAVAEYTLTLKK